MDAHVNPYLMISEQAAEQGESCSRQESSPATTNLSENAVSPIEKSNSVETKSTFPIKFVESAQSALRKKIAKLPKDRTVIRLPSYEKVRSDPVLYAHANRVLHLETNPGNARALVQAHGEGHTAKDVWLNAPPIPLTTQEMDAVFDLPYARSPHPSYADSKGSHEGETKIPAWEMIRFSVNIMRGCFGGCTFCSITEHEGRIIH